MNRRLIRLPEVLRKTGYARSSLYRMIKNDEFPAPIKIGERASAWVESEIDAWIERRISSSRDKVHSVGM